ncbi:MAG: YrzE family protein [Actinomycetota bacterium]
MFGRRKDRTRSRTEVVEERMPRARGGVSLGAILTGVVVSFGALTLLLALAGGILAATDTIDEFTNVSGEEAVTAGAVAGIVLVIAWLLAYMWGGYTAGRMGRGAGFFNGLLVPIVAVLVLLAVGAIASALGAEAELNNPLDTVRLPVEESNLVDIGTGIGIAVLVAMFLGAILGGLLGARWHTKLERRVAERHVVDDRRVEERRHDAEDDRALEERRRLSERADERRRAAAAPAAAPPPPGETTTQPNEPVVTNQTTTTGSQPTTPQTSTRTAAPEDEKPSPKDRLTGKG